MPTTQYIQVRTEALLHHMPKCKAIPVKVTAIKNKAIPVKVTAIKKKANYPKENKKTRRISIK